MQKYQAEGDKENGVIEMRKLSVLRKEHGIYPSVTFLTLAQGPIHFVNFNMII